MSLDPSMKDIATAINNKDFEQFRNKAHSLKGACSYVGAGFVYYCCSHILEAFTSQNFDLMMYYYPYLVESSIEFKIHAKGMIADFEGKSSFFFYNKLNYLQASRSQCYHRMRLSN